jgi:hypothetical protein
VTTSPRVQPPGPIRVGGYTLMSRLGEGGMGVVHLAEAPDGTRLALKVLRPHVVGDEEARRRLTREMKSLARVRSPLVAEIIDADPWGDVPFVATRYVPGLSLHDHVRQEGPLTGPDVAWLARHLAEALAAVHRVGVVHRDVKPSNVLLEGRTPVLIDFGLARLADDDRVTRTGWLLGTPGYLAPELLEGAEPTPVSDVHAWAATVAYAGTGRSPYGRGPALAVTDRVRRGQHDLSGLDPAVAGLVAACLAPDPARRPGLDQVVRELATGAARPVPEESPTEAPEEPTLVMPPSRSPYRTPPPAEPAPEEPVPVEPVPMGASLADRARRAALGLGLLVLVAGAVAAAPYLALAALAAAVVVLRWCSLVGSGAARRRELRGTRWYDVPLAALLSPLTLVRSLPVTLLLLVFTAALLASAALVCVAVGVGTLPALPLLGLFAALLVRIGPGGSRVGSPVRRLGRRLALSTVPWLVALACLVGLGGGLLWAAWAEGPAWAPATEAPWGPGSWLDERL